MQTVESKDHTLDDIFNDYYIVPSYQREYVWGEEQVEQLLRDVYDEFSGSAPDRPAEYFIGSIVVCPNGSGVYELIDGQQRMTTAFITLCALRDRLAELGEKQVPSLEKMIADTGVDEYGRDTYRHRVVLQYDDSANVLQAIAEDKGVDGVEESTRSIENIVAAYRTVGAFFRVEFGDDVAELRRFFAYLIKRVKLIRVKTLSVAQALKVFETINDRGVGLDAMDLLKNLMFMQARREDFDALKERWKVLVDTLHDANEKPLRFLRYYVFAEYEPERLKEDELYRWFTDNAGLVGYDEDPLGFVERLVGAATAYTAFLRGHGPDGRPNRYLENLRYLSGVARQHLILLLAGRHLRGEPFEELCRQIEDTFFAYIIAKERTKEYEPRFIKWAKRLRTVQTPDELHAFLSDTLEAEREGLAHRFALAFDELTDQGIQKYRMRYILGKLTQYVNEEAWGSSGEATDLDTFVNRGVEVEHILPQNPSEAALEGFESLEEAGEAVHRFGNLTLLEKPINASIQHQGFAHKKAGFAQSKFLLTKTIAEDVAVGKNTAVDRAVADLHPFEAWTAAAIDERQEQLSRLAHKVWEVPLPKRAPDKDGAPDSEIANDTDGSPAGDGLSASDASRTSDSMGPVGE